MLCLVLVFKAKFLNIIIYLYYLFHFKDDSYLILMTSLILITTAK